MNQNESLLDIFVLLYKKRRRILIASFLVAFITAAVSLLLPNYYEASTLFYAASPDLAQPVSIDDRKIYGSDSDLDRLFSIAQSNELKSYLISEFDLYDHYEIDSTSKKGKEKLLLKLGKLYNTKKTRYDAIDLAVEDTDPAFAADMANQARARVNDLAMKLIRNSQKAVIAGLKKSVADKTTYLKFLNDSLYNLRKRHNIFNTASQGEAYGTSIVSLEGKVQNLSSQVSLLKKLDGPVDSINVLAAKLAGTRNQLKTLKQNIKDYNEGYPSIISIEQERKEFNNQLLYDKERLSKLESAYSSDIEAVHVIQQAEVPVIKSRPKRSFLVIGAAF
ncbi:MAG: hypothetical protein HKO89_08705, partial [Saprospiraceae bacterium]|nr:hypothetical protein [Saprospiraceae bacterium]